MADPKADPKEPAAVPPKDDASLSELARAMKAQEGVTEVADDGSGGVLDPSKPKPASKETPAKAEKPEPAVSQEKDKDKDGEPKEDGEKGDENPFEGIDLSDPKEAVKALLKIPNLGEELQRWSDTAAASQVQAAMSREGPKIKASAAQEAENARWDSHFASMSQEDIGEEIAKDEQAAVAYSNYKARLARGAEPDAQGIAAASQVYAFSAQIALNKRLLEESDLPAEKKAELDGNSYTKHGPDGILMWGEAIEGAILEQKAESRAQELLSERWETFKEEQLAREDPNRPPIVQGSKTKPIPDLLEGESGAMMETALAHAEEDKK
jgi:hypothetical protein